MEAILKDILEEAIKTAHMQMTSPKAASTARKRGRAQARKVKWVAATAAGDIEEIWVLYIQLFEQDIATTLPMNNALNEDPAQWIWEGQGDLGAAKFAGMSKTQLSALLQFKDGLCSWTPKHKEAFTADNPDMHPLSLLWHQMVGVASVIDGVFRDKMHTLGAAGVLITDAVGVGKTTLTMGVIAFIIDPFIFQKMLAGHELFPGTMVDKSKVRQASIIEHAPYFSGCQSIQNKLYVILVSNSLVAQWYAELCTFFHPHSIEIYIFPTAEAQFNEFWEGNWKTLSTPMINCIILVPHLVMTTCSRAFDICKSKMTGNAQKATDEPHKVKSVALRKKFISYERTFCTVAINEAHEFRNTGTNFYVALELTKCAQLSLLLTATLLFTSSKICCDDHYVIPDSIKKLRRYDRKRIKDTLPEYAMIVARIGLSEAEIDVISKVMDGFSSGKSLKGMEDGMTFNTKFYLEGRTKAAFPFHVSPTYPPIELFSQWK
ncbi:hypothetical protein HYDPIDRAFT_171203, partial [Hydnomerulius pinastri MD-312]